MNRKNGAGVEASSCRCTVSEAGAMRVGLAATVVLVILGISVAAWFIRKPGHAEPQPKAEPVVQTPVETAASSAAIDVSQDEPPAETKRTTLHPRVVTSTPPVAGSAIPARPEPSPFTRQLVTSLSQIDIGHGAITPQQAAAWKQTLQQLGEQKGAAIPAIREFLEKNVDISFDAEADRKTIGASSLRLALLDTAQTIGGPEAQELSMQMLQTTADPLEIATITKYLEQSDPGKYRDAALNAAREALNVAASGQWDGRDISPLLEILKQYGGPAAAQDLQKLGRTWFDYTPMVLAALPDGAGVPALIQWAKTPEASAMSGNDIYLRMLAQTSTQYREAFDTLLEQAAANRIPQTAWPGIAAAIGGSTLELANPAFDQVSPLASKSETRKYHIAAGNQNFLDLPPPENMPADSIATRVEYLDRLISSSSNPVAIQALQSAKAALVARNR